MNSGVFVEDKWPQQPDHFLHPGVLHGLQDVGRDGVGGFIGKEPLQRDSKDLGKSFETVGSGNGFAVFPTINSPEGDSNFLCKRFLGKAQFISLFFDFCTKRHEFYGAIYQHKRVLP